MLYVCYLELGQSLLVNRTTNVIGRCTTSEPVTFVVPFSIVSPDRPNSGKRAFQANLKLINQCRLYRTLIFASPIQEVFPGDPFGGKNIVPVGNSMDYTVREDHARPSRSPAVRDTRCAPDGYTEERTGRVPVEPFRADGVAYTPPRAAHPSHRHERDLRYLLHGRSPSTTSSLDASVDVRVRVDETPPLPPPRAYRNDFSPLPPYRGPSLSERANRWSTSSNEYDDARSHEGRSADFYTPNRRHQLPPHQLNRPGMTRSFRERRPKLVHTDRNFRRSFTGRVDDYRIENELRRANFSMETSL